MPLPLRPRRAWPLAAALLALAAGPAAAQAPAGPVQARPVQARPAAADAPVTPANLSRDMLKAMYDAAKVPASVDEAGNLVVRLGQVEIYVLPAKDTVRLLVSFSFAPRATLQERLDLANRINDEFILVRASLPAARPGEIAVDHYVVLGPGISRAALVATTRRFAEVVVEAVDATDSDRLLK